MNCVVNTNTRYFKAAILSLGWAILSDTASAQSNWVTTGQWQIDPDVQSVLQSKPNVTVGSVSRHGTPTALVGKLGQLQNTSQAIAESDITAVLSGFLPAFRLAAGALRFQDIQIDGLGSAHARYTQWKNGLEVIGSRLSVHIDKNGKVYAIFGSARDGENLPQVPAIAESTAQAQALAGPPAGSTISPGRLIYEITSRYQDMYLAWEFEVAGSPNGIHFDELVYVDALKGGIVDRSPRIFDAMCREVYKITDTVLQPPPSWWPYYVMYSSDDGDNGSESQFSTLSPTMGANNVTVVTASSDLFTNLQNTYNFYKLWQGRDSYDNAGGKIVAWVNWEGCEPGSKTACDSVWIAGSEVIYFGLGGNDGTSNWQPLAMDPSIVTHEFSHGVTEHSSDLDYAYESGGLNESFSDCMASAQNAYSNGWTPQTHTWQGAWMARLAGPLRHLNNPDLDTGSFDFYPDWVKAEPNISFDNDHGEVHESCAIASLAYYLLSQGGTAPRAGQTDPATGMVIPTTNVPGLGVFNAANVVYRANTVYLGPRSQFVDDRMAFVQAATDLGLNATSANLAWDAVGVPSIGTNNWPINVSSRANVGTGSNIMIGGFTLAGGSTPKALLIRADGPSLAQFGVNGCMPGPVLALYSGQTLLASNDDWCSQSNWQTIQTTASNVGAFSIPTGTEDSALLYTFNSGSYTGQVYDENGGTGQAEFEVYDTNPSNTNHLVNLSTRCQVTSGAPMIMGFVINGTAYKRLLLRAVGPGLAQFGVTGFLATPRLTIYSGGNQIYQDNAWNLNDPAIPAAEAQTGAFVLTPGSADSALVISLPPGPYTAFADSQSGGTGVCLLELYEVNGQLK